METRLKSAARLMLVFVVGALLSARAWSEQKPIEMVVSLKNAKTVAVRQAPSADAAAIAFVENGKPVFRKGMEESNGFVTVQLADGRTGWTKASFLVSSANAVVATEQPKAVAVVSPVAPTVAMPAVGVPPVATAAESVNGQGTVVALSAADHPRMQQERLPAAPAATADRDGRPVGGLSAGHLLVAGLVGLLVGLLVGGKSGMVYATKSIHERYEVIN